MPTYTMVKGSLRYYGLSVAILIAIFGTLILMPVGYFYFIGSLITSSTKALTEQCGEVYQVESVFNGNFFCPERSDGK